MLLKRQKATCLLSTLRMNEKRYLRLEMCLSSTCNRRNVCLSGAGGRIVACLQAHTVVCVKAPGRVMRVVTGVTNSSTE